MIARGPWVRFRERHLQYLGPKARARQLAEEERPYPNRAARRAAARQKPRLEKIAARKTGKPLLSVLQRGGKT